jgi:Flp pilus assembly protein TadB
MIVILGVVLAVLLGLSFVALGLYAVVGLVVVAATVRAARREHRLAGELDRVLDEIVGPRSPLSSESVR